MGDSSLTLKGLITLNETAEFIWDRLADTADAAELAAASAALSAVLVAAADEAPSTCAAASSAAAPSPAYTCDGETAGQQNPIKTPDTATDSA